MFAPAFVLLINQRVDEVANNAGEHGIAHVSGCLVIELLCVCLNIRATVCECDLRQATGSLLKLDVHHSSDLPEFNQNSHTCSTTGPQPGAI